jgi:predicted PurR-regulated permease PerM
MGTVGGLQSFGLLGIFLGPVIVAVGKAIFDEWLTHARPAPAFQDTKLQRR